MTHFLHQFRHSESGAVTIDWVVLTAAVVGLGLAAMGLIRSSITDPTHGIGAVIAAATVEASFHE